MPPEVNKLLVDIQSALADIHEFTLDYDLLKYRQDAKCKAAV